MASTLQLSLFKGQDYSVSFAPDAGQAAIDITGWTLLFNVRLPGALSILFALTIGSGITVTDVTLGQFTVTLTAAQTATMRVGQYSVDIWRDDVTSEDPLAIGSLQVKGSVRYPS